jgi:hypothetical protein
VPGEFGAVYIVVLVMLRYLVCLCGRSLCICGTMTAIYILVIIIVCIYTSNNNSVFCDVDS